MASWEERREGPYDWRVEGPLAYWYHVESQGYGWDNAPIPPKTTILRWIQYDSEAFALYWPTWYAWALSGDWDRLSTAEVMGQVSVNPPRVSGFTPPPPSPPPAPSNNLTSDLKMSLQDSSYATPIDGGNDIPAWLKVIDSAARSAADIVGGFQRARSVQDQQAAAFSGNENHPLAQGKSANGWPTSAIFWGGLILTGLIIWLIISARVK